MIIKYFCHCSLFGEIRSHYGEIPIHIPTRTEDVTGVRSTNYKYAIIPHPRNNRQHRKNEERIYPLSRALFSYSFIMQIVQRIIPSLLLPRSADLSSIQLNPAPTREPTDSDQRPLINQLHSVHDNNNNNIRKKVHNVSLPEPSTGEINSTYFVGSSSRMPEKERMLYRENLPCLGSTPLKYVSYSC